MAKITDIDCMKFRKSTHLAGIDVETIVLEKKQCILTIKEAYYQENVDVSGNKTNGYFIEFEEEVKDMVVNSTNKKAISKLVEIAKGITVAESRNIKNWTGLKLELIFDSTIKMLGKVVGGIRINEKFILPTLNLDSENFTNCKKGIKNGFTIAQIKQKYNISKEVEEALLHV